MSGGRSPNRMVRRAGPDRVGGIGDVGVDVKRKTNRSPPRNPKNKHPPGSASKPLLPTTEATLAKATSLMAELS